MSTSVPITWPYTRQEEEGIFGRHYSACWLIPWLSRLGSRTFCSLGQLGRPRRLCQLSEIPFLPASPGVDRMDWEGSLPFTSPWVGSSGRDKGERGSSLQVLPGGLAPSSSQEVGSGCVNRRWGPRALVAFLSFLPRVAACLCSCSHFPLSTPSRVMLIISL